MPQCSKKIERPMVAKALHERKRRPQQREYLKKQTPFSGIARSIKVLPPAKGGAGVLPCRGSRGVPLVSPFPKHAVLKFSHQERGCRGPPLPGFKGCPLG